MGDVVFGRFPTVEERDREKVEARKRWKAWRKEKRKALVAYHANKRRAAKLQRTPPWADMEAIKAIYDVAARVTKETGVPHHVDHIVPLQGERVSGLHCEDNLQVIPASENAKKYNFFEC